MASMIIPNRQKCEKVFKAVDKDKSGKLKVDELLGPFQALGMDFTSQEIKDMLAVVDTNNDGELEIDEFVHFVYVCQNSKAGDMKRLLFLATDKNFSQTIDQGEMFEIFKRLGAEVTPKEIDEIFAAKKDNPDGTLSYKAYEKILDQILQ